MIVKEYDKYIVGEGCTGFQNSGHYNSLKGGRNSTKSSVISLELVYKLILFIKGNKKANIVVTRKVANTIRDSFFNEMQWAISVFGLTNEFKATVSPYKITHKRTGSSIYFYGQDDFQKLKSNDINDGDYNSGHYNSGD